MSARAKSDRIEEDPIESLPATARWLQVAFPLLAAAAASFTLWLGRSASFWHDECDFLHHRSLADPLGLFVPHNDHAVLLPAVAYRAVADLAGTNSYMPFLALLQVAHIATAAGLYAILRRRSEWLALGAAAVFLLLGSGADNLFWAFQITFVGSAAFGMWALWAAERDRWRLTGALLIGSVFCSLVGVPFVVAAAAIALLRRDRSVAWVSLSPILLGAWWWMFGRDWERPPDWAIQDYGSPLSAQSWSLVPGFIFEAAVTTVAGVTGQGLGLAFVIATAGIGVALVATYRGWRPSPLQLAAFVGFITLATMVGVIRAVHPLGLAPRHIYLAALFALLMLPTVRRGPVPLTISVIAVSAALAGNVFWLATAASDWTARAHGTLACLP